MFEFCGIRLLFKESAQLCFMAMSFWCKQKALGLWGKKVMRQKEREVGRGSRGKESERK